ncbi:MAG: hypothetical protein O7B99_14150 [Planctomycetota bacterium]|nr:hypothetical protein [Planctomycetota bacterium]
MRNDAHNQRHDPGLERTTLASAGRPYVGAPQRRPIRRFAKDRSLDRLLHELYRGFGPQRWWPAETPFEVVVGAVLAQNTSWRNVELAIARLRKRGPITPAAILNEPLARLERSIFPSGTYRSKAKKLAAVSTWYLAAGGLAALRRRPLEPLREELLGVFGVGPETADSILCYAASRRTAIVDAYTRRILGRHGLVAPEAPYEEIRSWLQDRLTGSQAVYEEFHALCVRAGYNHCKPTAYCDTCPATTPSGPIT